MLLAQNEAGAGALEHLAGFVPFILIFVIFYWLLIRPQRKRELERQKMIESLKKNDRVITTGGMFGTVVSVREREVVLRVDDTNNVRVRIAKNAIAAMIKESSEHEVGDKQRTDSDSS